MRSVSRRDTLKAALFGAAGASLPGGLALAAARSRGDTRPGPGLGGEGQRTADLGDGTYRNPIVPGDHPDPTILKDGDDYYMTFSSFLSYPGVVIWHSRDLIGWSPVVAALTQPIGSVWAMDLVKHGGRYFIYLPVMAPDGSGIFVIHADDIRGPWSAPIDLGVGGCIDPGHAVGEDGKRYLFFNGVRRIRLADDGLSTVGPLEQVHSPWRYPADWVVEMFAPEGPKVFRRGDWFYLVAAVGGTAGPPTSHMVTVARAKSIHGPWQDSPHNPVVHTRSADEPWWSRGHASVVEGPAGDWWLVYHGYENGYRTLGRQALLEPIEWTRDGWFRARGGTLARPLGKPRGGQRSPSGPSLSDDFSANRLGVQWAFHDPAKDELSRARYADHALVVRGKGTSFADASPLTCIVGDRSYEAAIELELVGEVQGGFGLFYDARGFVGVGCDGRQMLTYNYGQEQSWMRTPLVTRTVHRKLCNRAHVVTFFHSVDGKRWQQHPWQMEVSGYHQNVFGGFLSLRLAIFSAGRGEVRLRSFVYRGLEGPG